MPGHVCWLCSPKIAAAASSTALMTTRPQPLDPWEPWGEWGGGVCVGAGAPRGSPGGGGAAEEQRTGTCTAAGRSRRNQPPRMAPAAVPAAHPGGPEQADAQHRAKLPEQGLQLRFSRVAQHARKKQLRGRVGGKGAWLVARV